jgi:guanylate kinase
LPPSIKELESRLRGRGTDSDEKIRLRLKNAEYEITRSEEFDHRIVNDYLGRTVFDLKKIIIERRNLLRGE